MFDVCMLIYIILCFWINLIRFFRTHFHIHFSQLTKTKFKKRHCSPNPNNQIFCVFLSTETLVLRSFAICVVCFCKIPDSGALTEVWLVFFPRRTLSAVTFSKFTIVKLTDSRLRDFWAAVNSLYSDLFIKTLFNDCCVNSILKNKQHSLLNFWQSCTFLPFAFGLSL